MGTHAFCYLAMDENLYNGILAALEAVHGGHTASEVRHELFFLPTGECSGPKVRHELDVCVVCGQFLHLGSRLVYAVRSSIEGRGLGWRYLYFFCGRLSFSYFPRTVPTEGVGPTRTRMYCLLSYGSSAAFRPIEPPLRLYLTSVPLPPAGHRQSIV